MEAATAMMASSGPLRLLIRGTAHAGSRRGRGGHDFTLRRAAGASLALQFLGAVAVVLRDFLGVRG